MVSPNNICSKILFFSVACWNFLRKSVCAAWAFTASFALIKYWLRSAPVLRCALSNAQHACQASVTIPIPFPLPPIPRSTPLLSNPRPLQWISLLFAVFILEQQLQLLEQRDAAPKTSAAGPPKRQTQLKFWWQQSDIVRLTLERLRGLTYSYVTIMCSNSKRCWFSFSHKNTLISCNEKKMNKIYFA